MKRTGIFLVAFGTLFGLLETGYYGSVAPSTEIDLLLDGLCMLCICLGVGFIMDSKK